MYSMLKLFRRHTKACPHAPKKRAHTKCKCPVWVDGMLRGERLLRALDTKDWTRASGIIRDWEWAQEVIDEKPNTLSIKQACAEFMADLEVGGMTPSTIRKYRVLLTREAQDTDGDWSPSLLMFCASEGLHSVSQLDLRWLERFRATWKDASLAAQKKLERLRAFGKYLVGHGLWADNFAKRMRSPNAKDKPTMPFTRDEMTRLLSVVKQPRVRCLILLMRYTGLRIGDATSLSVSRVQGDKLFLYTAKTQTPVFTVLPQFVVDELSRCPRLSDNHWFWSGRGKVDTVAGNYRRFFRKLCKAAKIQGGHPHRLRDTFAVEMLLAGVGIDQVSTLLGHSSIRVTEKHYAPWVAARQQQAEAAIRRALAMDPLQAEMQKAVVM